MICADRDGEGLDYYGGCTDVVEEEYYIVFGNFQDGGSMTEAEICETMNTVWNGQSSLDPTAISAAEICETMSTVWNGQSSLDPTAISAAEIADVIDMQ